MKVIPFNSRKRVARALRAIQGDRCSICGGTIAPAHIDGRRGTAATVDHVYPRARYETEKGGSANRGNVTLAHRRCNEAKGDRDPTGCEIVWLHAVNAHMGWDKRRLIRKKA